MTFVSFASGSSGNCYLLTEGRAAVLLDTGISLRRIKTGLARRALTPDDLRPFSSRTSTPTMSPVFRCC